MTQQQTHQTFLGDVITVTNVLEKMPEEVNNFIITHILNNKLPTYSPNQTLDVNYDLRPRLAKYANDKAYVSELYLIVYTAMFNQKKYKRTKDDRRDEGTYSDLEAKVECLYRTMQALDRLYEACSRMMTGVGEPDSRQGRY